ncbi:trypsin-like peptidase domain-containing protein [Nocardioides sp. Y6]|uniref:Trypsin-like peptidase domain-containing protein n=1 Tax=Nocardioides malaquae TaxID=2773426 RepID=A0ABR9RTM9_9ACTN|nr:trypsin-like peptidase domain-containing protein [Nocardioides malaquae]MBE7324939.1 trypsin-like peptidase domain-containing protein [Nocardioides malaquae]
MSNERPHSDEPGQRPTPPPTFYGETPGARPHAEDDVERTTPLGQPWGTAPETPPQGSAAVSATVPRPRRGRRVGAALGALALGLVGGLGGAAAYDWMDDDTAPATGGSVTTSPVVDQGSSSGDSGTVEGVAAEVLPSVVRIDVAGDSGQGSGSGIVLSSDGQILTNEHVISAAGDGGSLRVSFADGRRAEARILGSDPLTDTAVIQAEGVDDAVPATIGKSGNLQVGQQVVAIGSPFGLDATVTSGIVSALDRPVSVGRDDATGDSTTYPAIQTDAAINPGNSGGPLVDLTGSVVGINSSIRTTSSMGEGGSIGLGFAIPIDEILPIVEQMAAGETPTHARLGISVTDASSGEGDTMGALVREVTDGAAAGEAGLEAGDVIVRIGDDLIDSGDDLVATVRSYRPGDEVEVAYVRDGEEQSVTLTLGSDADTN